MAVKGRLKEVDSVRQALFLRNFILAFPFLGLLGYVLRGIPGVLMGAVVSAGIALSTEFLSDFFGGGSVKLLFGLGGRTESLRERLTGDLNQVRYQKMCKKFDRALIKVEEILTADPEFPEALFLKAQILWDGFDDREGAMDCLREIMKVEKDEGAMFRRWAVSLYRELNEKR